MRLIDADKLKQAIPETKVDVFENCGNCTCLTDEQVKELIDDAPTIKALKEQQPKIMRLPEALGSYDPIFAEFRNLVGDGKTFTKWVDAVISMDARHVTITDLYCEETESRKLDFDFNLYNRAFRFWSTKPTDEQRKAVPWETH